MARKPGSYLQTADVHKRRTHISGLEGTEAVVLQVGRERFDVPSITNSRARPR